MVFKKDLFEAYVESLDTYWPTSPTGKYKTDKDTFSDMAKDFPEVEALKEIMKRVEDTKRAKEEEKV